jgi:hypothetical protein
MPELDDQDLDLGDEGGTEEPDGDKPPEGDSKPPKKTGEDKRISDLQSIADRETARANKAEAALKALNAGGSPASGSNDPERKALLEELREAGLDAVYGEFAELKDFGIDRALIGGTTRAEMRESATSLVGLIKGVATKARNAALREAGVSPAPVGGNASKPKDYAGMSDEEIEQEINRAKSGGAPVW